MTKIYLIILLATVVILGWGNANAQPAPQARDTSYEPLPADWRSCILFATDVKSGYECKYEEKWEGLSIEPPQILSVMEKIEGFILK